MEGEGKENREWERIRKGERGRKEKCDWKVGKREKEKGRKKRGRRGKSDREMGKDTRDGEQGRRKLKREGQG